VSGVDRDDDCCVLAAVGEGMVDRRGVAATMMGALAKANVNIKAIAQVRGGGGGCPYSGGAWVCLFLRPVSLIGGVSF
jgi:hypothetical protein